MLMCAVPALKLNREQIREMNKARNTTYRKIFGFNQWEFVKAFIHGLSKLDLKHIMLAKILRSSMQMYIHYK